MCEGPGTVLLANSISLFPLISVTSRVSWELFPPEQHAYESINPANSYVFHIGPTNQPLGCPQTQCWAAAANIGGRSLQKEGKMAPQSLTETDTAPACCHLSVISYHLISCRPHIQAELHPSPFIHIEPAELSLPRLCTQPRLTFQTLPPDLPGPVL